MQKNKKRGESILFQMLFLKNEKKGKKGIKWKRKRTIFKKGEKGRKCMILDLKKGKIRQEKGKKEIK